MDEFAIRRAEEVVKGYTRRWHCGTLNEDEAAESVGELQTQSAKQKVHETSNEVLRKAAATT